MDRLTFDSRIRSHEMILLAPYFNAINPTMVRFVAEGIAAFVDSLGHIEFFDMEENSLGFVDLPAAEDPAMYAHSGQYGEVRCRPENGLIVFRLPVYRWIDSYPHCDGESDRWDRRTVRWFAVTFDCKTHEITVNR